jgi:hypothetical protein
MNAYLFLKVVVLLWLVGELCVRVYQRRYLRSCGIPFSKQPT